MLFEYDRNHEQFNYLPLEIESSEHGSNMSAIFRMPRILKKRVLEYMTKYILVACERSCLHLKYNRMVDKYMIQISEAGIDLK